VPKQCKVDVSDGITREPTACGESLFPFIQERVDFLKIDDRLSSDYGYQDAYVNHNQEIQTQVRA